MKNILKINKEDNVAIALKSLIKGFEEEGLVLKTDIAFGHKIAVCDIKKGSHIIKYGHPIGVASCDIHAGEWVHSHNLKTGLSDKIEYTYEPKQTKLNSFLPKEQFFNGYLRDDCRVGIRNEIWILPTVGCVNKTAEILAKKANEIFSGFCDGFFDGFFAFTHPYGCSQLGEDARYTQDLLAGLAKNPNAGGVLILGLGCENNNLDEFLPILGDYNKDRIKTLVTQETGYEIAEGLEILKSLAYAAKADKRSPQPLSKLVVGLKCGGSDAFSGITANPLCGYFSDSLVSISGSVLLTEVPEMFGAETILMDRAANKPVFESIVNMINSFKDYYIRNNQVIYENPSPGNKEGGITTLEEKSLGCIQKGGNAKVCGVLNYAEPIKNKGLHLMNGPGNDIVSISALAASGAVVILFTTGRGTPLGSPVPTLKISSNTRLYNKKKNWIDFDAGKLLEHFDFEKLSLDLWDMILETANGKFLKNEKNGYKEIAIFKNGVTL